MGLNDEEIAQEKSLTDLMGELKALEDNAHNLADAPGAIRAKEREIIKAFGTAYDELRALFEGSNIEPLVATAKAEVVRDCQVELQALVERMHSVVEVAKQQLDDAKVQVADAVAGLEAKLTEVNATAATHAEAIDGLAERVTSVEGHPALSIPPLDVSGVISTPEGGVKPAPGAETPAADSQT